MILCSVRVFFKQESLLYANPEVLEVDTTRKLLCTFYLKKTCACPLLIEATVDAERNTGSEN